MKLAIAVLLVLLAACVSAPTASQGMLEDAAEQITEEPLRHESGEGVQYCMTMEQFNAESERCLVIVDGKVYDLSDTEKGLWGIGMLHQGLHSCGEELSSAILESPHGPSKLEPYEIAELCG